MIALCSLAAQAATFAQVPTLADLDRLSRAVVTGHVVAATTAQAPWGLVTTYDIAVDDVLSGDAGDRLRVQLPGGRDGALVQVWSGVPDWRVGAEVLVFVPRTGVLPLTGVFTLVDGAVVDPLARTPDPIPLDVVVEQIRGPSSLRR